MNVKLLNFIMRISKMTIYAFILCYSLSMALAINSDAQRKMLNEIAIHLDKKEVRLISLIKEIEQSTNFTFAFSKEDVKGKIIDLEGKDWLMSDLLQELSIQGKLSFRRVNESINVRAVNLLDQLPDVIETVDEQQSVTGNVSDENGEPLPGATIQEKGTTNGTITDVNGNFSLNVPENATISISFVGFVTKEVQLNGRSVIDVQLSPDISSLEEVVVVGYGTQKKSDLTGSVASISSSDFEAQPVIRIEDAINGKAAGVQVQKPNGAPGSAMKIRIRGANSINGGNDPLYVIDGYIGADITSLNPNEIESINILKDASATAIYGSRGSNGVVMITTKTAKAGDSKIEFNTFYSTDQIMNTYELLNGVQYMETVNARHDALNISPQFTTAEIDAVRANGGTDWQDEVFRNGSTQNYQLAFSGGNEKNRYYLSGTVAQQKGIILNSNYKRYGLRANINSKLGERFDLVFTSYNTYEESRNNYNQNGRNNASGVSLIFPPNISVWDETTNNYSISPSYGPIAGNPVFSASEIIYDSKKIQTLTNLQLNYKILEGLTFSVNGGVKAYYFDNPFLKTAAPGSPIGNTEAGHNNGYNWNLQNTNILNYNKVFAEKHSINVSAIYEQQTSVSRNNGAWATGFPTISLGYDNLSLGATSRVSSGYEDWHLQSYLGRLNYTFDEKYLFTATFRADGSSKFYGDNKYGYFPSGAFAWRLSDESFIQSIGVFQDLKLRASYGLTGSQAVGPYKTLSLLQLGQNYSFNGTTDQSIGIGPGVSSNPDLKWETTAQTDIGLDFSFFDGRLSGTVDYYYKKTSDLLLNVSIPDYSGGGSVTKNVGSLENKGYEFLLSGILLDQNKVRLQTSFNLSINRNKVLDLGKETEIFTDGGYGGASYSAPPFILRVGEPMGQFRGFIFDGLWKSSEAAEAAEYGKVPGDSKYVDVDGNKSYGGEDMVNIGSAQPDFIWGWNTTLEYAGFDLSIFINGVQGNDVWNQTKWLTIGMGADVKNPTSVDILNRWTPENENTTVAGFSSSNVTYAQSSQFVEDGSFIRLNNVTLGYGLPSGFLANALQEARIYVSAQNLFVITKYSGIDPELTSTPTWSDVAQGIDNGTYPSTRRITMGLKVTF